MVTWYSYLLVCNSTQMCRQSKKKVGHWKRRRKGLKYRSFVYRIVQRWRWMWRYKQTRGLSQGLSQVKIATNKSKAHFSSANDIGIELPYQSKRAPRLVCWGICSVNDIENSQSIRGRYLVFISSSSSSSSSSSAIVTKVRNSSRGMRVRGKSARATTVTGVLFLRHMSMQERLEGSEVFPQKKYELASFKISVGTHLHKSLLRNGFPTGPSSNQE